jgi:hypothetical protein
VPRSYKKDNWGDQVQLCEDRACAREAEESPLLEAFSRERLVKTQQAGKGILGAVVICELWRLAFAL